MVEQVVSECYDFRPCSIDINDLVWHINIRMIAIFQSDHEPPLQFLQYSRLIYNVGTVHVVI